MLELGSNPEVTSGHPVMDGTRAEVVRKVAKLACFRVRNSRSVHTVQNSGFWAQDSGFQATRPRV